MILIVRHCNDKIKQSTESIKIWFLNELEFIIVQQLLRVS